MEKYKPTGLPYVLSCDSFAQTAKKNRIKMMILISASILELLLSTKSHIDLNQIEGYLWTASAYPTLAGAFMHGNIAEKAEEQSKDYGI